MTLNILNHFDLSKYNTMALSCTADHAIVLDDESEVEATFSQLNKEDASFLILSGGSNIILPTKLNSYAILPRYEGVRILDETDQEVNIEVMAGNRWHDLVVSTVSRGWYGLENLALIPGLVGASPVQNIGAYGVQLEDVIINVRAFHIPSKTWYMLSKQECEFGYRDSIFKRNPNTWLISRVSFCLHKNQNQFNANYGDVKKAAKQIATSECREDITPIDIMHAIISIRKSKLPNPNELANTGSFFQNPIIKQERYNQLVLDYPNLPKYDMNEYLVKVPAGWLIERVGLKGQGISPILTHEKQALVLTNHAPYSATQMDIANTRDLIIQTVYNQFQIKLVAEPVWID